MADLATRLLPLARAYVERRPALLAPPVDLVPLAQGEYNLNYLATSGATGRRLVLRVSTGSQEIATGDEQIVYEARALELLAPLGIAPRLHHVDASRTEIPHGLLVEEFLPGAPLDYARDEDLRAAARTLAALHTFQPEDTSVLARLERPLSSGLALGAGMLAHYRAAPEASWEVLRVLDAAEAGLRRLTPSEETLFTTDRRGIVHTDVQAHNFIAAPDGSMRLVDWEKPLIDDPTYDLAHFLAPTTTRWKCGVDFTPQQERVFLDAYVGAAEGLAPGSTASLHERLARRRPFVHWRAITWCAMAWVEYQRPDRAIKNADTYARIEEYLQPGFLAALFAPVLA